MSVIYISLGSNIDPQTNLRTAVIELNQSFESLLLSPIYQSPAVGMVADDFLNAAACAETSRSIEEVVQKLRAIEDQCHRDRSKPKFSSRTLDLDLLLYDDVVFESDALTLPRADIAEQAFVLQPLVDLAADVRHPLVARSLANMLEELRHDHPQQLAVMHRVDDAFLSLQ